MSGRRGSAVLAAAACLGALAASPPAARAEDRKVGVSIEGPFSPAVTSAIRRTLRKRGVTSEAGGAGGDPVAAARAAGLVGFVEGKVERKGRQLVLTIELRNGADGETVTEAIFRGRNRQQLVRAVERQLWNKLGKDLRRAQAPEPEPEPEPEPRPESEPQPGAGDGGPGPAGAGASVKKRVDSPRGAGQTFEVAALARGFRRTFRYTDDLFEALREYTLGLGPSFGASIAWFPAARFGVTGEVVTSAGLDSRSSEGIKYPTRALYGAVGLRYRHALGRHELRAGADFGIHDYTIEDAAMAPRPEIPNVAYRFVRVGAEARLAISNELGAAASAGYRYIASSGEIEDDYFPRLSVHGVDASAWLGYRIGGRIEARAGLGVERYFYAMNPQPGDELVAGGAVDQYLAGFAAAVYSF